MVRDLLSFKLITSLGNETVDKSLIVFNRLSFNHVNFRRAKREKIDVRNILEKNK